MLGCTAAEVSQITGALLVFALLVMPAAAAQQLTARPVLGMGLAVIFGLAVAWISLAVAFYSPWPVGFFVSTFGFALYVAASALRGLVTRYGPSKRAHGRVAAHSDIPGAGLVGA